MLWQMLFSFHQYSWAKGVEQIFQKRTFNDCLFSDRLGFLDSISVSLAINFWLYFFGNQLGDRPSYIACKGSLPIALLLSPDVKCKIGTQCRYGYQLSPFLSCSIPLLPPQFFGYAFVQCTILSFIMYTTRGEDIKSACNGSLCEAVQMYCVLLFYLVWAQPDPSFSKIDGCSDSFLTNFHYFAIKKKGPQQPGQGNFLKKNPKKS